MTRSMKMAYGLLVLAPIAAFSAMQDPLPRYRPESIKMPQFDSPQAVIPWRQDLMDVPDYPQQVILIEPQQEPAIQRVEPVYQCHHFSLAQPDGWNELSYFPCTAEWSH